MTLSLPISIGWTQGAAPHVNCQMACCAMSNVLVSTTRLPNYPSTKLPFWRFGNRTKYIRHRTTSHLTANICDWPVTSTYGTCSDLPAGERYDYYYGSAVDRR